MRCFRFLAFCDDSKSVCCKFGGHCQRISNLKTVGLCKFETKYNLFNCVNRYVGDYTMITGSIQEVNKLQDLYYLKGY